MSEPTAELSLFARVGFGLLMMACGLFPMLAAFDVGPLGRGDINGPPWLGFVAGAIFFVGGASVLAGPRLSGHPLSRVLLFALIAGFAAIGNWIAFGVGPRACGVDLAGFFVASLGASDLVCRAGFGVGALILNGTLVAMLAHGLGRVAGPGPFASAVESVGKWVLFESVREYFKTGRWPRNEAFIARMKLKKKRAEA